MAFLPSGVLGVRGGEQYGSLKVGGGVGWGGCGMGRGSSWGGEDREGGGF